VTPPHRSAVALALAALALPHPAPAEERPQPRTGYMTRLPDAAPAPAMRRLPDAAPAATSPPPAAAAATTAATRSPSPTAPAPPVTRAPTRKEATPAPAPAPRPPRSDDAESPPSPTKEPPAAAAPTAPVTGSSVVVAAGDSFWRIAERVVTERLAHAPSDEETGAYWVTLVAANRDRLPVPGDADLLFPGTEVLVPAA
jgi:hypothetical protein